jgi:hypothetical protein
VVESGGGWGGFSVFFSGVCPPSKEIPNTNAMTIPALNFT